MSSNIKNSKSQKSSLNFLTSISKGVITSLIGFIVTPIIIRHIGAESYGVFKLIIDWLSNIWMFDLGISGAFLSFAVINIKQLEHKSIFQAGFYRYLSVLPLMFLACSVLYFLSINFIKLEEVSSFEYTISFLLISLTYLFYPFNVFRQYFEVTERISLVNNISTFQMIFNNLLYFILAYLGFGLIGLSFAYILSIILGLILIFSFFSKEVKWKISDFLAGKELYKEKIKKEGKSFLLINISQKISFLADNTIIAYFFNPAAVVPFFISSRLANLFQSQIQSLTYSSWASIVDFYNRGEFEKFNKNFKDILKFNFILSLFCFNIIWLLNEEFITIWIGSSFFIDHTFNMIITFLSLINILNFFIGHILSATGFVSHQSKAYIITGIVNLVSSIALTYKLGFYGPVLASLITMSILFIIKLKIIINAYSISSLELIGVFAKPLGLSGIVIFICEKYIMRYYSDSWFDLILFGLIISSIFLIFVLLFGLNTSERSMWFKRIKSLLRL